MRCTLSIACTTGAITCLMAQLLPISRRRYLILSKQRHPGTKDSFYMESAAAILGCGESCVQNYSRHPSAVLLELLMWPAVS